MASKTMYVVTVQGGYGFPIDMLRYDLAWPHTEEDSGKIAATYGPKSRTGPREIQVIMHREPTIGRWASFGWTVTQVDARRIG